MTAIDLNCDLGEGAGHDAELMPLVTSANIACGGHAGDAGTMRATAELAAGQGVAIGAHPGFEDRKNFGRSELTLPTGEVFILVTRQVRALAGIVRSLGQSLSHVKPHGGLYNLAARDRRVADEIAQAVWEISPQLILVGLAGSQSLAAGRARGLPVASEAFADRAYVANGSLLPRSQPGAVIADPAVAAAQGLRLAREGRVRAAGGTEIEVRADTLCLHGDGADAVDFARRLRAELESAGIGLRALPAGAA
jgi:5-oxoprolinase (ATP-hydrolysing) subunit A